MLPEPQITRRPKIEQKRRGVRLNARVRVVLEWEDEEGTTLREQTFTRVVGPFGCLVVLPQGLSVEQSLRVVNLVNEQANSGRVVWKGTELKDGWELGIELAKPSMDFWGLELC